MQAGTHFLPHLSCVKRRESSTIALAENRVNAPGQPLKIRIEVLAMPMGELPLDEVASQPSEVARPMLVHSCCRLGHSANPPGFRLSFADWLRPLALPLSAGASALRQQNGRPGSRHGVRGGQAEEPCRWWDSLPTEKVGEGCGLWLFEESMEGGDRAGGHRRVHP